MIRNRIGTLIFLAAIFLFAPKITLAGSCECTTYNYFQTSGDIGVTEYKLKEGSIEAGTKICFNDALVRDQTDCNLRAKVKKYDYCTFHEGNSYCENFKCGTHTCAEHTADICTWQPNLDATALNIITDPDVATDSACLKGGPLCETKDDCVKIVKDVSGVTSTSGVRADYIQCRSGRCYYEENIYNKTLGTQVPATPDPNTANLSGYLSDLKLSKPLLSIRIPNLTLSDAPKEPNAEGYLNLPWIGEYITGIYRFSLIIATILAVVMLIVQGAHIVISAGGEETTTAYKRVGQIVTGLFLLWGSYGILYSIDPSLTQFNALRVKLVDRINLSVYDKPFEIKPISAQKLQFTGYDDLFQFYAPCIDVDWKMLKATAYAESALDANVQNRLGFTGLFQTIEPFCKGHLKDYPSTKDKVDSLCSNLRDPQVSTMVGVSHALQSINTIKRLCPNATGSMIPFLIYMGHHQGPGALGSILKADPAGCTDREVYLKNLKTFWETKAHSSRPATEVAQEARTGGTNLLNILGNLGATELPFLNKDTKANCPLYTGTYAQQDMYRAPAAK